MPCLKIHTMLMTNSFPFLCRSFLLNVIGCYFMNEFISFFVNKITRQFFCLLSVFFFYIQISTFDEILTMAPKFCRSKKNLVLMPIIIFPITGQTETEIIRCLSRDYKICMRVEESETELTSHIPPQTSTPTSTTMNELLSKYTRGIGADMPTSLDEEVTKFMQCAHSNDEVLDFWKKNELVYPRLAMMAKTILAIPITSACAESAFSIAGCLIRSRRASIAPHRVEKVLFLHDNYDLFNL